METQSTDEFRDNAKWAVSAKPIACITGDEFKMKDPNFITKVTEFFNSIGGKVHRQGFGDVALTKKGVRDSSYHGLGAEKAAAFAAVPDVIKHGKMIDHQTNYKGRKYDTYVIAAPIKIGNVDYVMEVVINRNTENRNKFYLHEVEQIEKVRGASTPTESMTPRTSRSITAMVLSNNIIHSD